MGEWEGGGQLVFARAPSAPRLPPTGPLPNGLRRMPPLKDPASPPTRVTCATPWWAGASMRPLDWVSSPGLGLFPRYPRFSRGVGLETGTSPIHLTPAMNVALIVW